MRQGETVIPAGKTRSPDLWIANEGNRPIEGTMKLTHAYLPDPMFLFLSCSAIRFAAACNTDLITSGPKGVNSPAWPSSPLNRKATWIMLYSLQTAEVLPGFPAAGRGPTLDVSRQEMQS